MKALHWLCVVLVTSMAVVALAADIQVTCEPGLRVFLDGKLVGVSSAKQDGLFLADVKDGTHALRVERDGFLPWSLQVEVAGSPVEVKVERLIPVQLQRQSAEASRTEVQQATGSLRVTSAPQNCLVDIDGKAEAKNAPVLVIQSLTAGEHTIAFSRDGYERISGVVRVHAGVEANVRGDLIAGKVETTYEGLGSLRVLSVPEHCAIQILGMTREKTRARLNMTHLPAGDHPLVLSWKGGRIATTVTITKGTRTIVKVNFLDQAKPLQVSYEPE